MRILLRDAPLSVLGYFEIRWFQADKIVKMNLQNSGKIVILRSVIVLFNSVTFARLGINFIPMKSSIALLLLLSMSVAWSQIPGLEGKNWYFGTGTDGFVFDAGNVPYKVSNKMNGVGFEGMVVVSDPLSGALVFYSDGQTVVNASHAVMLNGTGLFGHSSGAQTVNCVPMPGQVGKFYLLTSRAWDNAGDNLFYSVVDLTDPSYPLGKVTNKNTLLSSAIYGQANKVISKPGTTDYWWVGHVLNTNTYHRIAITGSGFSAITSYTATGTAAGDSYAMAHSHMSNKLAVSGLGALGLVFMNFNSSTGAFSNPTQIWSVSCGLGNFSPNGSKLYFIKDAGGYKLHQYDLSNGVTTNMNTCCYAHDTKTGPDGKMYHIHTYYSSTPIAVINFPNLSAVGNACGYVATAPTIIGAFNGQSRRFPEFVVMPTTVLGSQAVALSAQKKVGKVDLVWSIEEHCSSCTFEIERGNGHGHVAVLAKQVSGAALEYAFEDANPGNATWYYRIKLIDAAGKMSYSPTVQVHGSVDGKLQVELFPNPCQGTLHIACDDPSLAVRHYDILDLQGRRILAGSTTDSNFTVEVASLNAGTYLLKLNVNGQIVVRKFEKI